MNIPGKNYFPYDGQNGVRFSKINGKDNEFEYNLLIVEPCTNLKANNCIAFYHWLQHHQVKIKNGSWELFV